MILIIGYGNPLRSDDAIGQRIAEMMEQRLNDVQVQVVYQLTPELVESVRHAEWVFFIDARVGETLGKIIQEAVEPQAGAGAFTHNVSPATLLGAVQEFYGMTPRGILISIVGASFDYGSQLSPKLNHLLRSLADQVESIIQNKKEKHHA